MSDVDSVIQGLATDRGGFVFSSLILVGGYFIFKNIINKFIEQNNYMTQNITEQLKAITAEVRMTRESLMGVQERVYKLELDKNDTK